MERLHHRAARFRLRPDAARVKDERDRAQTATEALNDELAVEGKLAIIQREEKANTIVQRIQKKILHHRTSSCAGETSSGPLPSPENSQMEDPRLAEAEAQLAEIQELYFEERMRRQLLESELSSLRSPGSAPSSSDPAEAGETVDAIICGGTEAPAQFFTPTSKTSQDSSGWYSELFADELTMLASATKVQDENDDNMDESMSVDDEEKVKERKRMLSEENALRARLEELRRQRKFNELSMIVHTDHAPAEESTSVPRSSLRARDRVNTDPEGAVEDAARPMSPKHIIKHDVLVETKGTDGVIIYCVRCSFELEKGERRIASFGIRYKSFSALYATLKCAGGNFGTLPAPKSLPKIPPKDILKRLVGFHKYSTVERRKQWLKLCLERVLLQAW